MADLKKFLDQAGVSTLWSKVAAEIEAKVKSEADRAKLAEQDLAGDITALDTRIGALPEGSTATTVIDYVNKKTEGIATDAALQTLQGDVNTIKSDYLKAADKTELAAAAKAADDKAVAAQGAVDALSNKVGTVPADKTVVQMIADAQTAATYDDTKVKEDIAKNAEDIGKNTAAIGILNSDSAVEGSVDYKIAQAVAAIMENPDETMNSIQELVNWINDHADDALALSNQVSANKDDIAALEGLVGETAVATQITDAIAAALTIEGVDKYALAADLTAAIGRITAIENDYLKAADKTALQNAINAKADQTALDEVRATADAAAKASDLTSAVNTINAAIALKASQQDLEAEVTARQAAVKVNADAIKAIKDHGSIDSFNDVAIELEKKQNKIDANTYDEYGAAATALTQAKAYTDSEIDTKIIALTTSEIEAAIANASK